MSYPVVVVDTARPGLRRLRMLASDRVTLHRIIAKAAVRATRARFAEVAQWQRNKFGKPPQFWKRMSRATRPDQDAGAAYVVMPSEVAQRYFGGPIRPTGGRKFLTIPASRKSYRRAARTFPNAVVILFKKPKGAAQGMIAQPRKVGRAEVLYWLVKGVNQKGDPRVLPTPAQYLAAIRPDVDAYLLRRSRRASASSGIV